MVIERGLYMIRVRYIHHIHTPQTYVQLLGIKDSIKKNASVTNESHTKKHKEFLLFPCPV